jgi:hypothetical protein
MPKKHKSIITNYRTEHRELKPEDVQLNHWAGGGVGGAGFSLSKWFLGCGPPKKKSCLESVKSAILLSLPRWRPLVRTISSAFLVEVPGGRACFQGLFFLGYHHRLHFPWPLVHTTASICEQLSVCILQWQVYG